MPSESTAGLESDFLEKVWASNTTIRTRLTTVRLEKPGASTIRLDQETLERIRRDGALEKRKSRSKRSRKR